MLSPLLVLGIAHRFGWNSIFNLHALTSFLSAGILTLRWDRTEPFKSPAEPYNRSPEKLYQA
jgi:hypothetical protein